MEPAFYKLQAILMSGTSWHASTLQPAIRLGPACSVWGLLTVWPQTASPDAWLGAKPVGHSMSLQQLVLPGPELETKPNREAEAPLVVRIDGVWPHGSDHRYDLSVLGLEAGEFDLRPYLRLKGGGSHELPTPLQVRFESILPEGAFEPTALKPLEVPLRYGYGDLLKALTVLWVLGLIGLWVWVRGGRPRDLQQETQVAPPSLIEQLQPLIERAASGQLDNQEKARLEKMILGYWAQRLQLKETTRRSSWLPCCNILRQDLRSERWNNGFTARAPPWRHPLSVPGWRRSGAKRMHPPSPPHDVVI